MASAKFAGSGSERPLRDVEAPRGEVGTPFGRRLAMLKNGAVGVHAASLCSAPRFHMKRGGVVTRKMWRMFATLITCWSGG